LLSSRISSTRTVSVVRSIWWRNRVSKCARHSGRLAIRGASPLGRRLRRRTLTGGRSSALSTPASAASLHHPQPICRWTQTNADTSSTEKHYRLSS
jgi:hypothetical protein